MRLNYSTEFYILWYGQIKVVLNLAIPFLFWFSLQNQTFYPYFLIFYSLFNSLKSGFNPNHFSKSLVMVNHHLLIASAFFNFSAAFNPVSRLLLCCFLRHCDLVSVSILYLYFFSWLLLGYFFVNVGHPKFLLLVFSLHCTCHLWLLAIFFFINFYIYVNRNNVYYKQFE